MSAGFAFASPLALLLLPVLAAWLLLALRGGPGSHRPGRAATLLLGGCALLLVMAAARPHHGAGRQGSGLVLLLDVSPSIPAGVRDAALRRAEALARGEPGIEVHRLAFAREAVALADPASFAAAAAAGREGPTDLTRALAAARTLLPAGGRVLLLSDGQHSAAPDGPGTVDPALLDEAAALPRAGVALHAQPIWPDRAPDVAVERVIAPAEAVAQAIVPVVVEVSCRGPVDPSGHRVALLLDGREVERLPLPSPCEETPHPVQGRLALPAAGRPLLEARREGPGDDLIADDDRAGTTVAVAGPAAVLWLGDPRPGQPLRSLLERDGHRVTQLAPEKLAASSGELAAYDMIVLDDVAAPRLVPGAELALEAWVHGGGGLLALGGPDSFGAGGYPGTRLDRLLPLSSDLRRTGGRMAVVLLVDKSGSMGGVEDGWERLLLAKETLRSLLATLGRPDDEVAIYGFDTGTVVLLPRGRVASLDIEGIDTGAIQAGGGTDPTPALREAGLELESSKAPVRQIIAITDGRFAGPDVEPEIRSLAQRGIRFSTIGVGATAEMGRLEKLATLGQGGVSRAREPRHLPRAVLREMLQAAGGVVRQGPVAIEPGSSLAADLHLDLPLPVPPVDGLNRTLLREGASRWLQTPSGDPLLAAQRRDAGLAIAFAAAPGRWTQGWESWPGAAPLWRAVLDAATRRPSRPWEAQARIVGERLLVALEAIDAAGSPVTGQPLQARVTGPQGEQHKVPLQELEPGYYQGSVAATRPGRWRIALFASGTQVAEADAVAFTPAEARRIGNDLPLLATLVQLGGGRLLAEGEPLPPAPAATTTAARTPLAPLALGLALAFFLAYLAVEGRPRRSEQPAHRRIVAPRRSPGEHRARGDS